MVTSPVFLFTSIVLLVLGIAVAVDASKYPDWAFERAGTKKWIYQVLAPISGFLCGIVAIVIAIVWYTSKKAQVDQAASSGGSAPPGTYGTSLPPPAPTWGPPSEPGTWRPPPPPEDPSSPPPPPPPPQ